MILTAEQMATFRRYLADNEPLTIDGALSAFERWWEEINPCERRFSDDARCGRAYGHAGECCP